MSGEDVKLKWTREKEMTDMGNPLIERSTGHWDTGQSDMGPSYPRWPSSVDMRVRAPRLRDSAASAKSDRRMTPGRSPPVSHA